MLEVMGDAERLSLQFNRERWVAILTQLMGLLALALSSVGLCGVVKLLVARRTAEIGLRIALGVANTESRRIVGGDCTAGEQSGSACERRRIVVPNAK